MQSFSNSNNSVYKLCPGFISFCPLQTPEKSTSSLLCLAPNFICKPEEAEWRVELGIDGPSRGSSSAQDYL